MKIVGMQVSVERSVKRAEYENEKVRIDLTVQPADAEAELTSIDLTEAAIIAKAQVYRTLGIGAPAVKEVLLPAENKPVIAAKPAEKIDARTKEGKALKAAAANSPAYDALKAKLASSGEIGEEEPRQTEVKKPVITNGGNLSAEIGEDDDTEGQAGTAADVEEPAAAQEISNGDMAKAVGNKMSDLMKVGDPSASNKITELVKKYVGAPPFVLPRIAAEQRASFLADLSKVKPEKK